MGALAFIVLNLVDALLIRVQMGLAGFELSPLVPPVSANLVARLLIALAIILFISLVKKKNLLGVVNILMCGVLSWHVVVYFVPLFINSAS